MPAPAAIRPSANDAAPIRATVGSSHKGMVKPSRLADSPTDVAMISGLRSNSRRNPLLACRAMGHTAATLKSGTHTPINTAIIKSPSGPANLSANARPMNELNRNAIWALAAWVRLSI